jgi:hypothetical protein
VSSAKAADPAREVARQHLRAQRLVMQTYLLLPLTLLVWTVWLAGTQAGSLWPAVVVPLALASLSWFLWRRQRYQVGRWATAGAWIVGVSVLFAGLVFALAVDFSWVGLVIAPATLVAAVLGALLGRLGQRAILVPLRPELAATQYELILPLRGVLLTTLVIGTSTVSVRARFIGNPPGGRDAAQRTYPLSEVTGVFPASLTGSERLKFPIALPMKPVGSAGPALILQARGEDWVLPLGAADAVAEFLNARVTAAKL